MMNGALRLFMKHRLLTAICLAAILVAMLAFRRSREGHAPGKVAPPAVKENEAFSSRSTTAILSESEKLLRSELALTEARIESMRPEMGEAYRSWRQPGGEIDRWYQYLHEIGQWEETPEGKRACRALQEWSDAGDGTGLHKGQPVAAKARQKSVMAEIQRALSDPEMKESAHRYLMDYISSPAIDGSEEEASWNGNMKSFPPRKLISDLLAGRDIEPLLAPESGVPEGVLDYMRLEFERGLKDRLVAHYIESTKPQALRDLLSQWDSLNERRFSILKQLGADISKVSKY